MKSVVEDDSPTKMSKRGAIALGQSIVKWINIVDGKDQAQGHNNCPMCTLYYNASGWPTCSSKCPIVIHTQGDNCEYTPYADFVDAGGGGMVIDKNTRKAAKAMLDLLIDVSVSVPVKGMK